MSADTPTGGSVTTLPRRPRQQRVRAADELHLTDAQLAEVDRIAEMNAKRLREGSAPAAAMGTAINGDRLDDVVIRAQQLACFAALLAAGGQDVGNADTMDSLLSLNHRLTEELLAAALKLVH